MKKIVMTIAFALAAIAGVELSQAGEPGCSAEPSCAAAPGCCDPGTCCPKCGCHEGLVPVCHCTCTTKKVTKYKYCCKCEDKCVCEHGPPCCASACGDCGSNSCGCECDKCQCSIYNVHKLVKIAYTVEEPVRTCTVEWVCPKCGCCCTAEHAGSTPAPATAPAPVMPAPPAPQKSANVAPSPDYTYAMPQR